jgi:hypothetical protein
MHVTVASVNNTYHNKFNNCSKKYFCHFVSPRASNRIFTLDLMIVSQVLYHYATSGLYYKTFRIVIYDRNDSMIVDPVL